MEQQSRRYVVRQVADQLNLSFAEKSPFIVLKRVAEPDLHRGFTKSFL
jgi:hypothetical protein